MVPFWKALANALRLRLRTLTDNEPQIASRIAVHPVTGIGYELYTAAFGQPNLALSPSSTGRRSARHRDLR